MLGAVAAGLFGAAFDQLTVTISADYFTLGKGLPSESLRAHAGWLGFRSALPLGALFAGVGLLRERSSAGFSWQRWIVTVLATTLVVLPAASLAMLAVDPFDVRNWSAGVLSPGACARYLVVWGLHVGAYAGVAAGIMVAVALSSARSEGR